MCVYINKTMMWEFATRYYVERDGQEEPDGEASSCWTGLELSEKLGYLEKVRRVVKIVLKASTKCIAVE